MAPNSHLSKPTKGGWKSAIFIIFVEVAERFAYYGVAGNLFTYLTKVLGQPTATAAKNVNTWQGVSALFPVVGAFLADSYVGRFKTIVISSATYLIGLILLTVAVSGVPPPPSQSTVFFIALYILAVGEGGHKPCVQTFAADQFDETLPEEKTAKSSFFNWWYAGIVFGATAAVLVIIYVEDYVSWVTAFGTLAAATAAALAVFLLGSRGYRREAPVGSPFTRVAQVVVAAARKRRLPEEGKGRFRFLNKATIVNDDKEKENPWKLCSVNQVEEVKLLLQLFPVWLTSLTFAIVIAQLGTYFTKQGTTLDRTITQNFQIPAASLQVFTGLTILVSVFLYEKAFIPAAKVITGNPSGVTILQRIGIGLSFSILTMVTAALIESKRVNSARENGVLDNPKATVPMVVWWLVPQYVLCGVSDVFTVVGLQELFYDQMPVGMRSVGAAAYISVIGVGSFLSSGLIGVVEGISSKFGREWLGENINRANLDGFYWILAGLSGVNLCAYVFVATRFVYKKSDECEAVGDV